MKKLTRAIIMAVMVFAAATGSGHAGDETTLAGVFVWENGNTTGDLEAVFTPTDEGMWDVAFNFEFRGKPHTYSGSAEGSLSEGRIEGRVLNENKKRTFTFEGSFADGEFSGTHSEVEGEKSFSTGTLTLR